MDNADGPRHPLCFHKNLTLGNSPAQFMYNRRFPTLMQYGNNMVLKRGGTWGLTGVKAIAIRTFGKIITARSGIGHLGTVVFN